jgi:uncharacterized cupredoxin-like copper-binding protein
VWAVVVLTLAAALAGCTGGSTPAGEQPPAAAMRVGLTEWTITTESATLAAGPVTLSVTNAGTTTHQLTVTATDLHRVSPLLDPGQSATVRFPAPAGQTLRLFCDRPGHEPAGMRTSLQVAPSTEG